MALNKATLKLALIPVLCLVLYAYFRLFPVIRNATDDEKSRPGFWTARDDGQTSHAVSKSDLHIRRGEFKEEMERLNSLKVHAVDPRLIFLIKKFYIEAPSVFPYNLKRPYRQDFSQGGHSLYVDNLLMHRVSMSTISLEQKEKKNFFCKL